MIDSVELLTSNESLLDLDNVRIDPKWALKLPATFAIRKRLLPLCLIDELVVVACHDCSEVSSKRAVERHLGHECILVKAELDSLQRALDRVYQSLVRSDFEGVRPEFADDNRENPIGICDELFQAALLRGASDIHLIPNPDSLAIHLRVDGVLEPYREISKELQPLIVSRLKVQAGMDIAEKRAPQDGRITTFYGIKRSKLEIRVATLPTRFGERVTLRLLANNAAGLTLESLGMDEHNLELFQAGSDKPHGLILLTGPTGSGKSTTLYVAIENIMRRRGGNVITIEDPIEYEIDGASQVEVDSADKVNFAKALRSVLRHDPDIIMIGEIRDAETASTAVKAALTGHLVFSTLHTNNSAGVVTRLIDMGVDPFLVGATLRMSVAQRLVRRLCPLCRKERRITAQESLLLRRPDLEGFPTFDPVGCVSCAGKGFVGRSGLFEILESGPEICKLIAAGSSEPMIVEEAVRGGFRALVDDGISKLLDGTTTVAEIASAISLE